MAGDHDIRTVELAELTILHYPHPKLREQAEEVEDPTHPAVAALVDRMFELMFANHGIGLAAPQVGVAARLFIGSPTFEASDRRVYINPRIIAVDGWQEGDEGCLSFPEIHTKVKRYQTAIIRAVGLDGEVFEETGRELTARLFQHEYDHLEGRLLVDRMGKLAKMSYRRQLRDLEETYTAG
jgi:peptide deformylase